MICASCVAEVPNDDLYCENCGSSLQGGEQTLPAAAKAQVELNLSPCGCGAAADEVDEDGFCLRCGRRVQRPPSDHIEQEIAPDFAGVSDRGCRHDRNEDRFALVEGRGGRALVVCDGVSATRQSEVASAIVTDVICRSLQIYLQDPGEAAPEAVLTEALASAQSELQAQAGHHAGAESPSTTVVTALVIGNRVTLGWAGDSRAYWIGHEGAVLLTRDHSWAQEVVGTGEFTEEQARAAPQAHAITRWLGADVEPEQGPEIKKVDKTTPGTLLLCTDGLWNYAPDAVALCSVLDGCAPEDTMLQRARQLVAFALEQGGEDNITVALMQLREPDETNAEPDPLNQPGDISVQGPEDNYAGAV